MVRIEYPANAQVVREETAPEHLMARASGRTPHVEEKRRLLRQEELGDLLLVKPAPVTDASLLLRMSDRRLLGFPHFELVEEMVGGVATYRALFRHDSKGARLDLVLRPQPWPSIAAQPQELVRLREPPSVTLLFLRADGTAATAPFQRVQYDERGHLTCTLRCENIAQRDAVYDALSKPGRQPQLEIACAHTVAVPAGEDSAKEYTERLRAVVVAADALRKKKLGPPALAYTEWVPLGLRQFNDPDGRRAPLPSHVQQWHRILSDFETGAQRVIDMMDNYAGVLAPFHGWREDHVRVLLPAVRRAAAWAPERWAASVVPEDGVPTLVTDNLLSMYTHEVVLWGTRRMVWEPLVESLVRMVELLQSAEPYAQRYESSCHVSRQRLPLHLAADRHAYVYADLKRALTDYRVIQVDRPDYGSKDYFQSVADGHFYYLPDKLVLARDGKEGPYLLRVEPVPGDADSYRLHYTLAWQIDEGALEADIEQLRRHAYLDDASQISLRPMRGNVTEFDLRLPRLATGQDGSPERRAEEVADFQAGVQDVLTLSSSELAMLMRALVASGFSYFTGSVKFALANVAARIRIDARITGADAVALWDSALAPKIGSRAFVVEVKLEPMAFDRARLRRVTVEFERGAPVTLTREMPSAKARLDIPIGQFVQGKADGVCRYRVAYELDGGRPPQIEPSDGSWLTTTQTVVYPDLSKLDAG